MGPCAYERWRASRLGSVTESLEQARILDLIGPVEGARILDLGCGDGLLTWTLAERGARAVGIDADRAMLDAASARSTRGQRQPPRFIEGRIEQLPFADGSFDVVVIVTVLCLVADRAGAVREAARVLRPAGRLVVRPSSRSLRERAPWIRLPERSLREDRRISYQQRRPCLECLCVVPADKAAHILVL